MSGTLQFQLGLYHLNYGMANYLVWQGHYSLVFFPCCFSTHLQIDSYLHLQGVKSYSTGKFPTAGLRMCAMKRKSYKLKRKQTKKKISDDFVFVLYCIATRAQIDSNVLICIEEISWHVFGNTLQQHWVLIMATSKKCNFYIMLLYTNIMNIAYRKNMKAVHQYIIFRKQY